MAEESLLVGKTLVIGLGTTGTEICRQLADRVRWEYGDTGRAPWLRFLCLETDAGAAPPNLDRVDFIPLTIAANEYGSITEFPAAYEEMIRLSEWADRETLQKIPSKSVDVGVGNIRMIGRLAFLHKKNYDAVRNAVEKRLVELRRLTGAEATERLGKLPDGATPDVVFASQEAVRVFVVGTLCGGTCSGLAGDFGYFLQSLTREEEKVIGIFTLPHPDLAPAFMPAANKFKKNAYTALVELNHYHLLAGVEKTPIPFPGRPFPTEGLQPYDLPFLVMPREVGDQSLGELHNAIADRIFLNVFVPATDPFAQAVNASIFDREGHAHSFCAFGLATLEFPAQQVMEACALRLLIRALGDWKNRPLDDQDVSSRLNELGLTWPRLRAQLIAGGIDQRLDDQIRVVVQAAAGSDADLARELAVFRTAFGEPGTASPDSPLQPNAVLSAVARNVPTASQQFYQDLQAYVRGRFLAYDEGPGRVRDLLSRSRDHLDRLGQGSPRDPSAEAQAVDAAVKQVSSGRRKRLFGGTHLAPEALQALETALRQEKEARLDREAQRALRAITADGQPAPGLLERLRRYLEPVRQRVDNLRARLTAYQSDLEARARRLAENGPVVNGRALFDTDRHDGTVARAYRECLEAEAGDPTITWDAQEPRQARQVVQAWTGVLPSLFPGAAPDWLKDVFIVGSADPLRPEDEEQLLEPARAPFRRLRNESVLDWWSRWTRGDLELERACQMMTPFLYVNETLAMQGGRMPIQKRLIALVPDSQAAARGFTDQVRAAAGGNVEFRACPDRYRAVLIEEWYRFPLYGAPSIVGDANGLATAQAADFPTFHTRRDVYWTGLSHEEQRRTQEAEELVVVGVLLGVLSAEGGALVLRWTARRPGEQDRKRMPFGIRGAARALVFERSEMNGAGQDLLGAPRVLRDRIAQERIQAGSDRAFIEKLVTAHQAGQGAYLPDWKGDNLSGRLVERYCAREDALYAAYLEIFPPDPARIESMTRRKGEARPIGGVYQEDGLYCTEPTCCGLVGRTPEEAARNGWRCFINPAHDYST